MKFSWPRRHCVALGVCGALLAGVTGCGSSGSGGGAGSDSPPVLRSDCETTVDPASFASAERLLDLNRAMDSFGKRTTASPQHQDYVAWLESQLRAIPGLQIESVPYEIQRWTATRTRLELELADGSFAEVPVAGHLPYSATTPASGIEAPLVYVPDLAELAENDVDGAIVVTDIGVSSTPYAIITALQWFTYDPDLSLASEVLDALELEALGELGVLADEAHEAGAAGLLFVHNFSREQVPEVYAPYEGLMWSAPGLYLGADEGVVARQAAAEGRSARLTLEAQIVPATTRMLIATLPGQSEERLVITSHTDGVNALWDNGPPAMVAMADYFAGFVQDCRPRTLEFAFTTAHLHQHLVPPARDGSAEQYARRLDQGFEDGTVAAVIVIEHLGAKGMITQPRSDGGPGLELVEGPYHEPNSFFVSESPGLITALQNTVISHDLERTIALRGADVPGLHIPMHQSFGGEGGPYHKHLLPTLAFITGPWTLFTTGLSVDDMVDGDLMHRQMLMFTDLVYALDDMPTTVLAGPILVERQLREVLCSAGDLGLTVCEGTPADPGTGG